MYMYKVGIGLLDVPQGGELVHTKFNRAGREVKGMKDPLEKFLSITATPEIRACVNICKK